MQSGLVLAQKKSTPKDARNPKRRSRRRLGGSLGLSRLRRRRLRFWGPAQTPDAGLDYQEGFLWPAGKDWIPAQPAVQGKLLLPPALTSTVNGSRQSGTPVISTSKRTGPTRSERFPTLWAGPATWAARHESSSGLRSGRRKEPPPVTGWRAPSAPLPMPGRPLRVRCAC